MKCVASRASFSGQPYFSFASEMPFVRKAMFRTSVLIVWRPVRLHCHQKRNFLSQNTFHYAMQPLISLFPICTTSVSIPSASKTLTISFRAMAVFLFNLELPCMMRTFIDFYPHSFRIIFCWNVLRPILRSLDLSQYFIIFLLKGQHGDEILACRAGLVRLFVIQCKSKTVFTMIMTSICLQPKGLDNHAAKQ